jgi:hypothetical protein
MEVKLNFGILVVLAVIWATLTRAEPSAALDPRLEETEHLARLEDEFARARGDLALAEDLAEAYLAIDRADLVIATLTSAPTEVQSDPAIAHRLARAFEFSGRVADALATAELALARCGRALGTSDSSTLTPVPNRHCGERTYASLEVHRNALSRMHAWGVSDPRTDSRGQLAYSLSIRAARILTASVSMHSSSEVFE